MQALGFQSTPIAKTVSMVLGVNMLAVHLYQYQSSKAANSMLFFHKETIIWAISLFTTYNSYKNSQRYNYHYKVGNYLKISNKFKFLYRD